MMVSINNLKQFVSYEQTKNEIYKNMKYLGINLIKVVQNSSLWGNNIALLKNKNDK